MIIVDATAASSVRERSTSGTIQTINNAMLREDA